jgi:hypothetical protein
MHDQRIECNTDQGFRCGGGGSSSSSSISGSSINDHGSTLSASPTAFVAVHGVSIDAALSNGSRSNTSSGSDSQARADDNATSGDEAVLLANLDGAESEIDRLMRELTPR